MAHSEGQRIHDRHIDRRAYLYMRQPNRLRASDSVEIFKRQCALRQRALVLGWAADQIIVIADVGQPATPPSGREGFLRLVAEIGMGNAGFVMGLEAVRMARDSRDWHGFLEICALTDTLLLDGDSVYDPAQLPDRLILGLKGLMPEDEIRGLRLRWQ